MSPRAPQPTSSLRELAQQRRLPAHQLMDHVTLKWIESNRPANFDAEPSFPRPGMLLVPPPAWFTQERSADSIHGTLHNGRVGLLAALLAEEFGLDTEDTAAACIAGIVHDCRRHDDRADPGHGQRAATWLLRHADTVTSAIDVPVPAATLERAATAVALHDVPYENFTSRQERAFRTCPLLVDVLKAADCLDRYRLPRTRWWPDTSRLRLALPDWLPAVAFALVTRSEQARLDGADPAQALTDARQTLTPSQNE
ncbi:hypothetical protein [Streptomyces violascens]|uniref:hypothetical protein n=1 Tax=Streptomyces violascens TaxID=67381 RepID=UPI001673FE65|nr:hypothetical protein [Streptomyces violascens]GGU43097.1 hypothetical protein GCM10010289_74940 [Streptomyces violascens]